MSYLEELKQKSFETIALNDLERFTEEFEKEEKIKSLAFSSLLQSFGESFLSYFSIRTISIKRTSYPYKEEFSILLRFKPKNSFFSLFKHKDLEILVINDRKPKISLRVKRPKSERMFFPLSDYDKAIVTVHLLRVLGV